MELIVGVYLDVEEVDVLVVLPLEGLHLAVSGVELESELRVSRLALRQPLRRHARPHARLHLQQKTPPLKWIKHGAAPISQRNPSEENSLLI